MCVTAIRLPFIINLLHAGSFLGIEDTRVGRHEPWLQGALLWNAAVSLACIPTRFSVGGGSCTVASWAGDGKASVGMATQTDTWGRWGQAEEHSKASSVMPTKFKSMVSSGPSSDSQVYVGAEKGEGEKTREEGGKKQSMQGLPWWSSG